MTTSAATDYPKISLVTAVKNCATYIEDALVSVLEQGYPNLEYVVFDGDSTDSTPKIIESFSDELTFWASEPDRGLADALNKGFGKTTGDIMGWLNGDDLLMPGALFVLAEVFSTLRDLEWITGAHTAIRDLGQPMTVIPPIGWSRSHLLSKARTRSMPQESTFWKRSLWDRAGGQVDPRWRYAVDYELWVRFSRHALPVSFNAPLGCFRHVKDQISKARAEEYQEEVDEIRAIELGRSAKDRGAERLATKLFRVMRKRRDSRYLSAALGAPPPLAFAQSKRTYYQQTLTRRQAAGKAAFDVTARLAGRFVGGVPAEVGDSAEKAEALDHRLLVHLHIPKSGGTTLNMILREQYGSARFLDMLNLLTDEDLTRFAEMPPEVLDRCHAMRAHMRFGIHELIDRPCTYVTIVRDPVARILSDYYYILETARHPLHEKLVREQTSLSEFIDTHAPHNAQVRMLAVRARKVSEKDVEAAVSNLRKFFSVVGVTERFDESLVCFKLTFGWPKTPARLPSNVTKKKPASEDPAILTRIAERNHFDQLLYEEANRILDRQIAGFGARFHDELRLLREANEKLTERRRRRQDG